MCDEKTVEYLRDLIAEKQAIVDQRGEADGRGSISQRQQQQQQQQPKSIVLKLLDQGKGWNAAVYRGKIVYC